MRKALWMILAVCLLAVYANAATVTFTADDSVAYPGKYQITASVSGSYGLASFKIYAPQGTFANAVFKAPQTVFVYDTGAGILFTKDCGFSLLRSFNDNTTINAAIAEASQNTVGFDPDELPVPDYAEYYIPVLAYGIGQVQVDLEALCPPSYFVQGGYDNHLAAAEVVLIDNLDSVPALKIGATLESLEDMVSGQEYAPQCGTLANVFVNNTDNTTEAANVVFVNTKLPTGVTVSGAVDLQDYYGDVTTVPVTILICDAVGAVLDTQTVALDASGNYTFTTSAVGAGTYTLKAKAHNWLQKNVTVAIPATGVNFSLINGDCNNDNIVDDNDYSDMSLDWYNEPPTIFGTDLNGDGIVDDNDYSILSLNWYAEGDY